MSWTAIARMDADRALIALALVLSGALVAAWIGRRWRALRARYRHARALRGERDAERILGRAGWTVEARQVARTLALEVDGVPTEARVRCDLVVRRGARRCVAEVKTGALAPRLDHAPTRRQLLEYRLAFDVDGVLLVDAEAGRVVEVRFPFASPPPVRRNASLALAFTLGAALAWTAAALVAR